MKNFTSVLLFLFISNCFAQTSEPLTEHEISLIQNDSMQTMHVSQLKNPKDSIILKTISKTLNPVDKYTQLLSERMLKSVNNPLNQGVGIAAPQVGINRRLILVQRFDKPGFPFDAMVNPEIIWRSKLMQDGPEGDLSFEKRGNVKRHYTVEIQYYNLKGEKITEILEGFTAVIFQHERDHLDGILFIDRIKEQGNLKFEKADSNSNLYFKIN